MTRSHASMTRTRLLIRQIRYVCRQYIALAKIAYRIFRPQIQAAHGLPYEVIISLTSFRPRFATLHLTLECLLRQDVKPDRVILWIDPEDMAFVPDKVKALVPRGLDIRQTARNIGPYSKIIPTLAAYPDAIIVTTDDDTYYQARCLRLLLKAWSGDTKEIICHMAFEIQRDMNGNVRPYKEWYPLTSETGIRYDILPFGVGGVLYPPGSLPLETLDEEKFTALSPRADDIWLYWMARRNGCGHRRISGHKWVIAWPTSQKFALKHTNNIFGNDVQMGAMAEMYGWPPFDRP